jgi:transcriptional antiterminator RfaH
MALFWYALQSKPNKERILWEQVRARMIEVFFPRYRIEPKNPRAQRLKPYFPRYMFVHSDLEKVGMSTFNHMPFAIGLVCFGGEPATIPDALIQALKQRIHEIEQSKKTLFNKYQKGDRIRIREGPFEGYLGLFDEQLQGQERVRVLIEFIHGFHTRVQMDSRSIEPLENRNRFYGLH